MGGKTIKEMAQEFNISENSCKKINYNYKKIKSSYIDLELNFKDNINENGSFCKKLLEKYIPEYGLYTIYEI